MQQRWWSLALGLALIGCSGGKGEDSAETVTPNPGAPVTGGTTGGLAPNAQDDLGAVDEGGSTNINVASNDLVTSNPLALGSVTLVATPQFGSVSVQTNGTLDYTHDGSETTGDSFTYTIEDSIGATSNIATVQVTIAPVNDAPVATDDADSVDQGQGVTIDLAANDNDVDDGLDLGSIAVVSQPAAGTVTVNNDGTVDYTQDGSATPADSFTYTIADIAGAVSNTATVALTINTSNAPPVALDDFVATSEGASGTHDVVYNDYDPDGTLDLTTLTIVSNPANGTASANTDGTIDYDHNGTNTTSDSLTYTIRDNQGAVSNTATVQFLIAGVNDPPVAANDAAAVDENQSVNIAVLANDSDSDGLLAPGTVTVVSQPSDGTLTVNPDGSIDYAHDGSQNLSDSFTYTVDDDAGATSNIATVDLTITLINDPPVVSNDSLTLDEGTTATVDLVANDVDTDDAIDPASLTIVSQPAYGTLVDNGDGTVDYSHDGSETASDSFTYTVDDLGGGTSNLGTVSITIDPVNDPPVASNDADTVSEGTSGNVLDLAANDSDPDDGLDLASISIVSPPANGSLTVNANGTVDYDHDGSEGGSDSFTYTIADGAGATSNAATVSLTIAGVNDAPVAVGDNYTVTEGSNSVFFVLNNDSDADDGIDPASLVIVSGPSHAVSAVQPGGTVSYNHDGSEGGSDSFTYRVSDFAGAVSNTVTVNITVQNVNDPPVASNDSGANVANGGTVTIDLAGNDSDVDDGLDLGSIAVISAPSNGSVFVLGNGSVDYTHNGSATLADSFTYTIDDNSGASSNIATVDVTIDPAPQVVTGGVYGVRETGDILALLDPTTATFTDIGPLGTTFDFGELAYDSSSGTLYMVDGRGADALWTVDVNTGAATMVGVHGVTDLFGLAYDPRTDALYASQFGSGDIYALNRSTGAATFQGLTGTSGDGMTFDTTRQQLIVLGYSGVMEEFDPFVGASFPVATVGGSNNNGVAYDPSSDLFWKSDWSGNLWTIDPSNGYTQVQVNSGLGAFDGLTFVEGGGHQSEVLVPDANQGWFCGGVEQVYYAYYGEITFDECQLKANNTGAQWYGGASSPYNVAWIGEQDATTAGTTNGGLWTNEVLIPRTNTASCVLGLFDDVTPAPVAPVENIYLDPGTGRVWHYWDLTGVTHSEAIAFAMARGARIINPNSVGMTGLARMTAPTHWCHAGAEWNGGGNCNTNNICNFYVGYWD